MRRARVLLVAPQPFFTVRGTPLNVLRMVRTLCGAGHDVHLATYGIGETIPIEGLTYHRAPPVPGIRHVAIGFSARKIALDAALALRVWQLQLTHRFDLIHAVEESVFLALPLALARRVPLVYDVDSVLSDQLRYSGAVRHPALLRAIRAAERLTIRRSSTTITVCSALTDAVRALEPNAHVVQIEDCPEMPTGAEPAASELAALRQRLGVPDGPLAVYVGNLESYQGVDLLLEAWRDVQARLPRAHLLVAGGSPEDVAAARARVRAWHSGADSVTLAGAQPREHLPSLLAMATVLVSPRLAGENTPLKVYTYMASGRPIVATRLRTHTQVLDSSTAVLAEPEPKAMADAITSVLTDPDAHRPLGEAARDRVETRYSERVFARKLLDAYASILDRTAAPPT